ncbi:hypothetical protein C21_00370 [Arenibacter sp. NBRC 103722]|nr:hypothetical protein C21_00370 [Arenibacter sp. NBRC 103722]
MKKNKTWDGQSRVDRTLETVYVFLWMLFRIIFLKDGSNYQNYNNPKMTIQSF